MSLWLKKRLVSAGNIIGSNKRDAFDRSLTCKRKGSGPRIDPLGTPQLTYLRYECTAFYWISNFKTIQDFCQLCHKVSIFSVRSND